MCIMVWRSEDYFGELVLSFCLTYMGSRGVDLEYQTLAFEYKLSSIAETFSWPQCYSLYTILYVEIFKTFGI